MKVRIFKDYYFMYLIFLLLLCLLIPAKFTMAMPIEYISCQEDITVEVPVISKNNEPVAEGIYKEIIYLFLEPAIEEVLTDYYPRPLKYDRRNVKLTKIERPNGGGTFYFVLQLEVCQYTGPYDKIGIDYLTLENSLGSRLRALEYKHSEGFDFHQTVERNPSPAEEQKGFPQWPEQNTEQNIYRDLAVELLSSCLDEAIYSYYGQYYAHDPWSDEVLELIKIKNQEQLFYRVKIKALPYTGPHNSVGLDHITLKIAQGPKIQIEQYKHLKSYVLKTSHYCPLNLFPYFEIIF